MGSTTIAYKNALTYLMEVSNFNFFSSNATKLKMMKITKKSIHQEITLPCRLN